VASYYNEHIELVATALQYGKLQPKSAAKICTETAAGNRPNRNNTVQHGS